MAPCCPGHAGIGGGMSHRVMFPSPMNGRCPRQQQQKPTPACQHVELNQRVHLFMPFNHTMVYRRGMSVNG